MGDVNKVTLIGTLTWMSSPSVSLRSGVHFVHFRMSTNVPFGRKEGIEENDHQEHTCMAFGDMVEELMKYKVHTRIIITGRLKYQQIGYDPTGRNNIQSVRIIVNDIQN